MSLPVLLLLVLTAVRLVVAALMPLSADEAYYWVWSRALAPGYLDHPAMVAAWIRIGTAIAGETVLGVRLLGPVAAALGSVLIAQAGRALFPGLPRAGLVAATLLNATLMLGAGAVTMTPDTPLVFFTAASLWALSRVPRDPRWWLLAGLGAGLAMDSKYTAVLWAIGIPIWVIAIPSVRGALRRPWIWAGGLLALAAFAPTVMWNAEHGWASFLKQGGRTGDWRPEAAFRYLSELLLGQFALATPLIFVLFGAGLAVALRRAVARDRSWSLLAALSVPALVTFLQHAIGDRVQANWVAAIYPQLALGAGVVGARWWRPAALLGFALTGLVYLQAAAAPFRLPGRLDPTLTRLAGWDGLAREADAIRRRVGGGYIASEDYASASLLAWWAPAGTVTLGVEPRWRLFDLPPAWGGAGLLLISERRREGPDPASWTDVQQVGRLVRRRAGVEAEAFRVYRAVLRVDAPAVTLPRGGGE